MHGLQKSNLWSESFDRFGCVTQQFSCHFGVTTTLSCCLLLIFATDSASCSQLCGAESGDDFIHGFGPFPAAQRGRWGVLDYSLYSVQHTQQG